MEKSIPQKTTKISTLMVLCRENCNIQNLWQTFQRLLEAMLNECMHPEMDAWYVPMMYWQLAEPFEEHNDNFKVFQQLMFLSEIL